MNKNGFTLIELIMIIVLIGVVFPLVLAPFMTSVKEVATPAEISRLTMLARGNMEKTLDAVKASFSPTSCIDDVYTDPDTGNQYTTSFNCYRVDSTLTADASGSYMLIELTTSDSAGNRSVSLQTLKARDYF